MDERYIDLSRIEDRLIKNNYVFALGFNGVYITLRATVVPDKLVFWDYDPIVEGLVSGPIAPATSFNGISNHTFVTAQRPKSTQIPSLPQFIFQNDRLSNKIYQIFFGISPSDLKVLFNQPFAVNQISLPVQEPSSTYNQYGFIPGKDTPIDRPGPTSQIWVPPGLDFGIGFINDQQIAIKPLIRWVVNLFEYEIVKDADLIYEILNTTKFGSLKTVGGTGNMQYNIKSNFGVPGFALGTPKSEIESVVASL